MKRRTFLSSSIGLTLSATLSNVKQEVNARPLSVTQRPKGKILNAYYFRAHMYTMVPRHVREDMKWMADKGTNVVTIAVLEQDLTAAIENINIVCEEAAKVGMEVHAVPSRWGGLFAGAPKVPSKFTATHPETWILNKEGKMAQSKPSGPLSSVHHPATKAFFLESFSQLLSLTPIKGVIWDEPKMLSQMDYSTAAVEAIGQESRFEKHVDAGADFIEELGVELKKKRPDLVLSLFIHASAEGYERERINKIHSLDYVGCDGRPWAKSDSDDPEYNRKCLIGNVEQFVANAKANNKKSVVLMENYNMPMKYMNLFEKNIPTILKLNPDQLIYYYYPRNIEDPDKQMAMIGKNIMKF